MTNTEIKEVFEKVFSEELYEKTSRLHCCEFDVNEVYNTVVTIYGGMNGWGDWIEYLHDLKCLLKILKNNGVYGIITKFDIDVLDDVFKVEIELRDLEEITKMKLE